MSRWLFAVFMFGFVLESARGADPKPLWEIDTVSDPNRFHSVTCVGFSSDGKALAALVEDRSSKEGKSRIVAWDTATQKKRFSLDGGDQLWVTREPTGATTPSATVLVNDGTALMVRWTEDRAVSVRPDDIEPICDVLGAWVDPNAEDSFWVAGRRRATGQYEFVVGKLPPFAEPIKGTPAKKWTKATFTLKGKSPVFALSSDRAHLAVASHGDDGHQLTLFALTVGDEVKLKELVTVPNAHQSSITCVQFSPDGKTLATGSRDTTVRLWDVAKADKDWKPRATVAAGKYTVGALTFAPDGRTLAAGTWDAKLANLFLIDVTGGKVTASHRLGAAVMALAYSPDGKALITGQNSSRIRAWDANALREP